MRMTFAGESAVISSVCGKSSDAILDSTGLIMYDLIFSNSASVISPLTAITFALATSGLSPAVSS